MSSNEANRERESSVMAKETGFSWHYGASASGVQLCLSQLIHELLFFSLYELTNSIFVLLVFVITI